MAWNKKNLTDQGCKTNDNEGARKEPCVKDATIIRAEWQEAKSMGEYEISECISIDLDIGEEHPLKYVSVSNKTFALNLFTVTGVDNIESLKGKKCKVILGTKEKLSNDNVYVNHFVVPNGFYSQLGKSATEVEQKVEEPVKLLDRLAKVVEKGLIVLQNRPQAQSASTSETDVDLPF